jgi:hypothetical protein
VFVNHALRALSGRTALYQANLELFSASADSSVRVSDIRNGNSRTVLDTFSIHHRVEGPT